LDNFHRLKALEVSARRQHAIGNVHTVADIVSGEAAPLGGKWQQLA
jgi:hypothetical protein